MNTTTASLHSRAMLAYVKVSLWSARKLDRKATKQITTANAATDDAARVNKHMLAGADEMLRNVTKAGSKVGLYLHSVTLPWDDAGNRLLPNDKAIEAIATIETLKQEFYTAVDAFVLAYPVLRAQALNNLGDMGDAADYPQPDTVRSKFCMTLSLAPMPEGFGDIRAGLSPEQLDTLEAEYTKSVRAQFAGAITEAWRRLRTNVEAIAERLDNSADPAKTKIFRNTLFENAKETCALLQSLNVFDDEALEDVRSDVETYLCAYDPDAVRASPTTAEQLKCQADAILSRMRGVMGE